MTTTRRTFLGALTGALTAAGLPAAQAAQLGDIEFVGGLDAVGVLVKAIDLYGGEAVAREILTANGPVDPRDILRRLNRQNQRTTRHLKAAARRDRHAGNVTLYSGPIRCDVQWSGREVRTENNRRAIVDTTRGDIIIDGVGVACPPGYHPIEGGYESDTEYSAPFVAATRRIVVPAGSRLLVDIRHGTEHLLWACEVVETSRRNHRIHLWQGRRGYDHTDEPPVMRAPVRIQAGPAFRTSLEVPQ